MMAFRRGLAAICGLLAACAQQPPEKQPPPVSVPVILIRKVCKQAHLEQGSGHWDGGAHLLWSTEGSVVAIDCTFTVFVDGLTTTTVRIDLRDERARRLRDFLESHGGRLDTSQ